MERAEILAGLTDIFRAVFDDDRLAITEATTAEDVDGWDSMENVNLMVQAEKRFGVKFGVEEIAGMKNVGDLVGAVAGKLG